MAEDLDAVVYAISDLQAFLERTRISQEAYQRDVITYLKEIAAGLA